MEESEKEMLGLGFQERLWAAGAQVQRAISAGAVQTESCTCYIEVAVVKRACYSPYVAVLRAQFIQLQVYPQEGHLGMPIAPSHHLHCLLLLRWREEPAFLPCSWLLERFLHVYLNYKALNNLLVSRVKRKIYDVSFWQVAADLDSPEETVVLTAPFSEQLLQVHVVVC